MNIIDIKGNRSKALILFKFFHNLLSLKACEYINMALSNSTHSFPLPSFVCVSVLIRTFSTLLLPFWSCGCCCCKQAIAIKYRAISQHRWADIIWADIVLFFYDKLEGETTYYYWQKTIRNGEYFINFDRKIINDSKYTSKITSNVTFVKNAFNNKKLVTSANSTEM